MIRITLVTVGKIKEKFFTMAVEEYRKRLSHYCKLEIVEVADERTPDNASLAEERQIKEREGDRILRVIQRDNAYVIVLAIEGKQMDSVRFSEKIAGLGVRGLSLIHI